MSTQQSPAPVGQMPPDAVLMQMGVAPFIAQALYVAAKLGIADLLVDKKLPVSDLAAATGSHKRSLYRMLRCLASVGVFAETGERIIELTPLAEPLRSDAPNSVRDLLIFMGEEWHWRVYSGMLYSVQTGKPAWGKMNGEEVFEFFGNNPEAAEIFNRAMTNLSVSATPAVVEAYDFTGIETLADIAGGHGLLLAGILKANPGMKGILFDVASVIEGAPALLEKEGVRDRVSLSRGSFFESIPVRADAYIMKHIIHDWDDERSITILKNIHASMPENGKVLIVEMVISPGNEPHFGKVQDLEMLVSPGGVERTEAEYGDLLAQAGFKLTRIVPTKSPLSIVEAVRAVA